MNSNTCFIIGAGSFAKRKFNPQNKDYIICADGGYNYIKNILEPNIIIGDNDSINKAILNTRIPSRIYPSEKNETDMQLCLEYAIAHGFQKIKIFGGYGSRPDHFIANLQLLHNYASYDIEIVHNNFSVFCLSNGRFISTKSSKNKTISIFALSNIAKNVTIEGLKYEETNVDLSNHFALGVSNQTIGKNVNITVKNGVLAIFSYDSLLNKNYFKQKNN